jgi:hypothetical protein
MEGESMNVRVLLVVAGVLAASLAAAGSGLAWTTAPAVTRNGDQSRIAFAVSAPTDVEVAVLDASGRVVRHLAAGVLGGTNAPPAPLKSGLAQDLVWDGKDDAGKPVAVEGAKVRVRAGLQPEFDSFLLDNPMATGAISALAIGPGGQIYLWHRDSTANGNQGGCKLKVMSRDGKYIRTLVPYPASLPAEKARVLGAFIDAEGHPVPRVYNMQTLSLNYEGIGDRGDAMVGFSSPVVDSRGRAYWFVRSGRLEAVEADGGSPYDPFLSENMFPEMRAFQGTPALCMSSDEKNVYVAGIKGAPCVWRVDTVTRKAALFLGDSRETGREKDRFTAPRGVAAAKGLLYVADPGADRVAVFKEADKTLAGEIKVKEPHSIGVDPASGAVYVCAYTGKQTADLIKFDGYEKGKELYRIALPKTGLSPNGGAHRIAVDASSNPVLIYVPGLPYGPPFTCLEDAGDKFVLKGDPRDLKKTWAAGPRDLSFDRIRGELYVKGGGDQRYFRVEEKSGKVTELVKIAGGDSAGSQLLPMPDGSLVTYGWGMGLHHLDRDGKPANWPGSASNAIPYSGIMTFMQRNMALPNMEEIFIILPPDYRRNPKASGGDYSSVNVLGTDGSTKRTVIWQCTVGAALRMDAKGNIYLADMIKPAGRSYPEFFDGKLPVKYVHNGRSVGGLGSLADAVSAFWESNMYGSIMKFPPSGGVIWYNTNLPVCVEGSIPAELLAKPKQMFDAHIGYSTRPVAVQGAEWVRFGFAPYGLSRGAGFCMCEGVGFDVDGWGRIFYPNLGQFRIEMVDNNNNWIGTFGKYGNADSGGVGASIKTPSIPFAWPTYVAVSDDYAYVNDTLSSRVVKVKLGAAVSAICEIK